MIITCPSCSARYPVDAASFAPSGRKVRCAKCGNTWHQAPPSDLGRETGNRDDDSTSVSSASPKVAAAAVRPAPVGQKPLFSSGDVKAKAKPVAADVDAANVAEKQTKPVSADLVGDDDIAFASESDQVVEGGERQQPDTPIKFREFENGSRDTGGTLRRYLNDVASMRRGRVFGAIGWVVLVAFVAGSIYGVINYRREIATFWPSTIRLYEAAGTPINLVGFELAQVTYERQDEDGLPVLAIKGVVENVSGKTMRVPRLRVGLRDEHQVELYHWTFALPATELKPDAKANFVTRLSSPPAGARDIEVRFVEPDEEPKAGGAASVTDGADEASSETPVNEEVSDAIYSEAVGGHAEPAETASDVKPALNDHAASPDTHQ
tara:strand:- start:127899 stop:129035 length:1137 start_codon:yes stop_codon:yes gene_type:complete